MALGEQIFLGVMPWLINLVAVLVAELQSYLWSSISEALVYNAQNGLSSLITASKINEASSIDEQTFSYDSLPKIHTPNKGKREPTTVAETSITKSCLATDLERESSRPHEAHILKSPSQLVRLSAFQSQLQSAFSHKEPLPNPPLKKSLNISPPRSKGPPPVKKALVIGINNGCLDESERLTFAVKDAERFRNCLIERLGFKPDNVRMLTDADSEGGAVPLSKITENLRWLFGTAKSGDILVLFISGHCQYNETNKVVSLISVEEHTKPRLIPSTIFRSYFDQLPPGCTVEVVLDCCYSAGLIKLPNIVEKMEMGRRNVNVMDISADVTLGLDDSTSSTAQGATNPPNSRGNVCYGVSQSRDPENKLNAGTSRADAASGADTEAERNQPHLSRPVASRPLTLPPQLQPQPQLRPPQNSKPIVPPPPNFLHAPVQTRADVTLWAASGPEQKAFESSDIEGIPTNGILTNAICKVIESITGQIEYATRQTIWSEILRITRLENLNRSEGSHSETQWQDQEPQLLILLFITPYIILKRLFGRPRDDVSVQQVDTELLPSPNAALEMNIIPEINNPTTPMDANTSSSNHAGGSGEPDPTTTTESSTPNSVEAEQTGKDTLRKSLEGLKVDFEQNAAVVVRKKHSEFIVEKYRVIPLDLAITSDQNSAIVLGQLRPAGSCCQASGQNFPNNQRASICPPKAKGNKAVAIGLNSTDVGQKKALDYAANDAKRFTGCLTNQLHFKKQDIRTITDAQEALSQGVVVEAIDWLFKDAKSDDMLVLFISGHCLPSSKGILLVSEYENSRICIASQCFRSYFQQLPSGCTVE
ncbi:hypothetical protein FRC07_000260, partial [Ceratobasidium sp. 392]